MGPSGAYKMGSGIPSWQSGEAQTITFVVTEDCNLRCRYCYMVHKSNLKRMTLDVAKKAVNYVLDNDNLQHAAAIIEFIGGEPLIEIELVDQITDYFKLETYRRGHRWFDMHRFSFSTNGILYSDPRVQNYLRKNKGKVSMGITIDGIREKHDLQRVYPDGRGSYDDVAKQIPLWLQQFPGANTKVTIGHDDLKYVTDSIIHLWDMGINEVPANVVFEAKSSGYP